MLRFRVEENVFRKSESPVGIEENIFDLVLKGFDQATRASIMKGASVNLRNDIDQTLYIMLFFIISLKLLNF